MNESEKNRLRFAANNPVAERVMEEILKSPAVELMRNSLFRVAQGCRA